LKAPRITADCTATPPPALLLSPTVAAEHGDRIRRIAEESGVALQCVVAPGTPEDRERIVAAFFSRDLYEGSSLRVPGALSDNFFAVVDSAPNLRWLHVCSSGLDLPQYQPSIARGVRVTPSSGATAVPIAQTVVAAVLAQSRGFGHWLSAQQARRWSPLSGAERPRELRGQRALILGTGPIGTEIARLLGLHGLHTIGVRRQPASAPGFDETVPLARLDDALPRADWLILALPLSGDTRGLLNARRLALMPRGARIANIARGELLDEAALLAALSEGHVASAYLDVFDAEPLPPDSPWWDAPRVWITPHNSAASQGHERRVVDAFVNELRRWLTPAPPSTLSPLQRPASAPPTTRHDTA